MDVICLLNYIILNVDRKLEVYTLLLGCKKKKTFLDRCLYFILSKLKWVVTFVSTQHDMFIKCVKWVGSGQPALLIDRIRVEGSWHDY